MKKNGFELTASIITAALSAVALVLFCLSYTTGYYIFGQMQSGVIAALLGVGIAVTVAATVLRARFPDALWPKFLTFAVTALLCAAAMLLVGDRVEGIGNCIVTDYDSGHGGEEAIYLSLAASVLMLVAVAYNIIGSFASGKAGQKDGAKKSGAVRWIGFGASAAAVLLAVLIPTVNLVRGNGSPTGPAGPGNAQAGGSYTVSFNQANGNAETMPRYQFLCSDFSGMVRADSRFYVDVTLTLDGNGSYTLFADSYVIEAGKRAEIGDDTGLGLVLTMNAEGTYTENTDGTVTTSVPSHAVFEMETDTYSAQMKGAAQMNVNGNDADGVYDSNDEPAVLDFVPETVWTLGEGIIETYRDANAGGSYAVSFNQGNGNAEAIPGYQFLCCDLGGMVRADSRFYIDLVLTLDGGGNYTLFADSYVIESGKRAEIGDDTGLGLVLTMNANGTYTENADGTYTTSVPTHAVFEMRTDTYSAQMKGAAGMAVNGNDADGVYDSNDEPAVLDFVPETIWTVADGAIVTYENANGEEEPGSEDEPGGESSGEGLSVASDDGATSFTFYADGTAKFEFSAYGVEDAATWTYEGGVLTVTNAGGAAVTAQGDPLKFHYVTSVSDQLTGDFTVPAADLEGLLRGGEAGDGLTVASDDGATSFTFYADGTAKFEFSAYGVEDAATWTYESGTLTVTNAGGAAVTAQGDPLKFHYVTSVSDQLTGDFTVPAADLEGLLRGGEAGNGLTVASDDGATSFTFYADGTAKFEFSAYGVEDAATWTYESGTLTVTNAGGTAVTAQGDPLKFHYVTSVSDQLTGDFTVPAADLERLLSGGEAGVGLTVASDDGATSFTFYADGTAKFEFSAYGVEDAAAWAYENGTLTVTNANGAAVTAQGDPLKFHYVTSVSDQLTGDFTVPAADLQK